MKILFLGPMGAGKTTAIAAVSDIAPITTEAENSDQAAFAKATTTVALDYGEIRIDEDSRLILYGVPGQARFAFMWPVLAKGAMGGILLLDGQVADPLGQLAYYLEAFPELVRKGAMIVAVGHVDPAAKDVLAPYRRFLRERGLALPLFTTDVRQRRNVLLLIESLIANAEVSQLLDDH